MVRMAIPPFQHKKVWKKCSRMDIWPHHSDFSHSLALQPTVFGARDRSLFEVFLCGVPRRQLMCRPLGRSITDTTISRTCFMTNTVPKSQPGDEVKHLMQQLEHSDS